MALAGVVVHRRVLHVVKIRASRCLGDAAETSDCRYTFDVSSPLGMRRRNSSHQGFPYRITCSQPTHMIEVPGRTPIPSTRSVHAFNRHRLCVLAVES
jgi:hypothetical protein